MSDYEDDDEENRNDDYGDEDDRSDTSEENESDKEDEDDDVIEHGDAREEKQEFEAERAAFERSEVRRGFSRRSMSTDGWKGRELSTDEENFADDLDQFYIPNENDIRMNTNDFETIDKLIDIIPHIKCKNPPALLLAYYTLDTKNMKINKDILFGNKKYKNLLNSKEVSSEDIIRYCRLILKYI
jgi:hypothetical protein